MSEDVKKNEDIEETKVEKKDPTIEEEVKTNRKLIIIMFVVIAVIAVVALITTIVFAVRYRSLSKILNDRGKGSIETNIIVGEDAGGVAGLTLSSAAEELDEDMADVIDPDDNETADNKYMIHFSVGGYKFYVPNQYECMAIEKVGIIIYENKSFQLKIVVKGRPYEEVIADEDSIIAAVEASNGNITSEIKSAKVNDNNYTFFRCNLSGDDYFVIYGETLDGKSHTGGQIEIFDKKLSDEDLLSIFDSVMETAEYDESYVAEEPAEISQDKIDSILTMEDVEVYYTVPTGLKYGGVTEYDGQKSEDYWSETDFVNVTITDPEKFKYADCDNAKDLIENAAEASEAEVLDEKIDDQKVYYYTEAAKASSGSNNQHIYAACDLGDGLIFYVSYMVSESDEELTIDTVKEFFKYLRIK